MAKYQVKVTIEVVDSLRAEVVEPTIEDVEQKLERGLQAELGDAYSVHVFDGERTDSD